MAERKVLIIVEGEKKDFRLMKQLFDLYLPDEYREIISYGTNIVARLSRPKSINF